MTKEKTINITIDNKRLEVSPALTILQAARANNIYIPSLCALEHLPSYGACRLCVVEVDGLRGFPTSCTTPVEDGMVIRTDTAEVRNLRQEVLKLLLSEHPASCLFCSEQDECKQYQGTIRKVGLTTGCRYCPNDNMCELQQITQNIGLTETSYPVYYRNFPVEKYDPFYDRDYNLCILCGRCVRVCNDIRLNGTLSFKQRGQLTTIGPAFDRSHIEAGCEFCGACVTVCPTGALSVKAGKWYGMPDTQVGTTCNFCSVGCRLILHTKNNAVIDALPDYDSATDKGLICVKGRFCITEYVHSPLRYGTPKEMTPVGYNDISWEQAISVAADKIAATKPENCLVIVSPQLYNEDLFVAQKFVREVIGSDSIVSSPLIYLGSDLVSLWNLAIQSQSTEVIAGAGAIIAVGFDSLYGYSPIGINVKKAAQNGACLITISNTETNLDILSYAVLQSDASSWSKLLDLLTNPAKKTGIDRQTAKIIKESGIEMDALKKTLSRSSDNLIILGPKVFNYNERSEVLAKISEMVDKKSWRIIVANPYTNLMGMIATGAFPGVKPGEAVIDGSKAKSISIKADALNVDLKKRRKLIYIIGEAPFDILPECDYLIYQNAIPANFRRQPDLILPVSLFPESEGTMVNIEGRIMFMKKAIEPYMESKPDWLIFKLIAEKLKKGSMGYKDYQSIQTEIKRFIKGFPNIKKRLEFLKISLSGVPKAKEKKMTPVPDFYKSSYRGIQLSEVVTGMKVIEGRLNE